MVGTLEFLQGVRDTDKHVSAISVIPYGLDPDLTSAAVS